MNQALADAAAALLGQAPQSAAAVGGGSISAAWRLEMADGPVFAKEAGAGFADNFAAEADGLTALSVCRALRVPRVIGQHTTGGRAFLFMEWLDLDRRGDDARLGAALADLHEHVDDHYGWSRDNYIGATPQPNVRCSDRAAFMAKQRIGVQLDLARRNGYAREVDEVASALLAAIPDIMADAPRAASMLHGDLWSGNVGFDAAGQPCLFDPAVYFGDPEADIAMSELFGGFGPGFYAGYRERRPETAGAARRRDLHRLYHLLNHLNLFGGGYLGQSLSLARRLLG